MCVCVCVCVCVWYIDKIDSLLEDTNIYEISYLTTINNNIISFNKLVKIS